MYIEPIKFGSIGAMEELTKAKKPQQANAGGFDDIFKSAWNSAVDTQQDLSQKQYLQSVGEIDDTHTVPIAAGKAELSLSLLVGLRNKALDAYNELMRMNI